MRYIERDIVSAEQVGGKHKEATKPIVSTELQPGAIMVAGLVPRDHHEAVLNAARMRGEATAKNLGVSRKPVRLYVNERLTKLNQQLFVATAQCRTVRLWWNISLARFILSTFPTRMLVVNLLWFDVLPKNSQIAFV